MAAAEIRDGALRGKAVGAYTATKRELIKIASINGLLSWLYLPLIFALFGLHVYLVKIDSGRLVRVSRPNIVRQAEDRISWDETVHLSWHASSPIVLTQ